MESWRSLSKIPQTGEARFVVIGIGITCSFRMEVFHENSNVPHLYLNGERPYAVNG